MSESLQVPPEPEWLLAPPRGRVLVFSPHPDDEVIGPGGTLCLHRRQGDEVRAVIATDGTAGDPDRHFDRAAYTALRRQESQAGLAEVGVGDLRFWGMPDSCVLSDNDLELGTQLAARELQEYSPQLVYLPWQREGHPDHHALHVVVMRALQRVGFAGEAFGYEVWHAMVPDRLVDITPVAEQKRRAVACHRTQMQYVDLLHVTFGLNAYRSLIHARGQGYGEAFVRLR